MGWVKLGACEERRREWRRVEGYESVSAEESEAKERKREEKEFD